MADAFPNDPPPATATAFWTVAPGRGELREAPLPAPGPGEVTVRIGAENTDVPFQSTSLVASTYGQQTPPELTPVAS